MVDPPERGRHVPAAARSLRVAALQLSGTDRCPFNWEHAAGWVMRAAEAGAELVVLPEMWNCDYFCADLDPARRGLHEKKAEDLSDPATPSLRHAAALARAGKVYLVAGVYERERTPGGAWAFYSSAVAMGPSGDLLGLCRKTHVDGAEERWFRRGELLAPVFRGPKGLPIGLLICYDRHFPEAAHLLSQQGALLLAIPSTTARESWTYPFWDAELRALATWNGVSVVAVNRVGPDTTVHAGPQLDFYGRTAISSPRGQILAAAGEECETLVVADVPVPRRRDEIAGPVRSPLSQRLQRILPPPGGEERPAKERPIVGRSSVTLDIGRDEVTVEDDVGKRAGPADAGLSGLLTTGRGLRLGVVDDRSSAHDLRWWRLFALEGVHAVLYVEHGPGSSAPPGGAGAGALTGDERVYLSLATCAPAVAVDLAAGEVHLEDPVFRQGGVPSCAVSSVRPVLGERVKLTITLDTEGLGAFEKKTGLRRHIRRDLIEALCDGA